MKKHFLKRPTISNLIIVFILLLTIPLIMMEQYMVSSVLFMLISFLPLMLRFERKNITSRELVVIAILAAIAAVSRVPFASIPSVQPTTFVIIMAGAAFGPETGFVVGTLAAIVSNLFLGQGPWTPWQMYAWGMIGLAAGYFKNSWVMLSTSGRVIFGFFSGFIFGWIMNFWFIIGIIQDFRWGEIIAYYSLSFTFDLLHALSNVFFLLVFTKSWLKILKRFQRKYGLLE